jgi:D-proline reductase (dithiol) PrdB
MCHRSVGLVQNAIEAAGIATVSVTMMPYASLAVGVPRALYARFPLGNPFGEPGDVGLQRAILTTALRWLYDAPAPNRVARLAVSWRRSRRGPRAGGADSR